MQAVNVIVNLSSHQLNSNFTYMVPEELGPQASFGKRVLVDFGRKKTEAFIVEVLDIEPAAGIKSILRVLDKEAVFNQELLSLARWMADYYSVSLAMVLSMMIPRLLHRKTALRVIATINQDRYYELFSDTVKPHEELFKTLWTQAELSVADTRAYLDQVALDELIKQGLVSLTGVYQSTRIAKYANIYVLNDFNRYKDMPVIRKKAPRQAEALELLLSHQTMACDIFDKMVTRSTTAALLKKSLIRIERQVPTLTDAGFRMNREQAEAVAQIASGLTAQKYVEYLLFGVTGSGKTEVYIHAAQATINQGRTVIVLVPEIALTRQLVDVFSRRIGNLAVLHSAMSAGERYEEWKRIKRGEAALVLGPRSAIFAPVPNLGLIIIDEEHETSYKQEEMPRYHVRDLARQRAWMASAVLLLGSATPSLETYYRASSGEVELLSLEERTAGATIPQVMIEDMRNSFKSGYRGLISPYLQSRLKQALLMGQQSILFLNRRGYSPMTMCRECGNIASCPSCSVGMTFHRDLNQNICHYCNFHQPQSSSCPVCGSKHLQLIGAGTQKVEEEVKQLFPQARIARLDLDSSRKKDAQKSILAAMKDREIDILIGTQMVAKGLDFPFVSLVGVVDADSMLNLPDFRARERCFQLLVQVAGRAGRADIPGEVVFQTYNVAEPLFQMAASQDYRSFYAEEIRIRSLLEYPPFTDLLRLVISGNTEVQCKKYSQTIAAYIEEMIDAQEDDIMILGPAPCPISKIKNRYRYQIMIKCSSSLLLRSIAAKINNRNHPADIKLELDLNPMVTM